MTETPGQAFRRVRKERCDKVRYLAASVCRSTSMINYVERGMRRIPRWWLTSLPPEYAEAIVPILIAELEELLPKKEKPRPGGLTGAPRSSRNLGEVTQANDAAASTQKSTRSPYAAPDPSPCSIGTPWGCGFYGESPEERAFRRYPITHKPSTESNSTPPDLVNCL